MVIYYLSATSTETVIIDEASNNVQITVGNVIKIKFDPSNKTEPTDKLAHELYESYRKQRNGDYTETRRHYHLQACAFEGDDFATDDADLEAITAGKPDEELVRDALAMLAPEEREILEEYFFKAIPLIEYAKRKGISQPAATKRKDKALRKLKEILAQWL